MIRKIAAVSMHSRSPAPSEKRLQLIILARHTGTRELQVRIHPQKAKYTCPGWRCCPWKGACPVHLCCHGTDRLCYVCNSRRKTMLQ